MTKITNYVDFSLWPELNNWWPELDDATYLREAGEGVVAVTGGQGHSAVAAPVSDLVTSESGLGRG